MIVPVHPGRANAGLQQGGYHRMPTNRDVRPPSIHPSIQVSHTIHHTGSHRHLRRTRQDVQRSWSSEDAGFIKTSMKKPSIAPKKNATSTISTLKQPRALSPSSCSLVKGQRSLLYCKLPSTKSAQEGIIYYPSRHVCKSARTTTCSCLRVSDHTTTVACERPLIGTDADY
jgi:hypothetical protein